MTFADLKTELAARGFSDLTDARLGVYINNARAELDRKALWPWREKSVTGTSPLSITDLGVVEAVTNETLDYPLQVAQWRNLLDWYGADLSTTGSPTFYYRASPSGTPAVATYPTSGDTIGVQYYAILPDLTGVQESPAPDEAHYLIVDLAVRRASRDVGDHAGAEAIQTEIDRQMDDLLVQYPPGVGDGDGYYITGYGGD